MAKLINPVYFIGGQEIASNSLDVAYGDLVTVTNGFLTKSVATDKIDGVAVETKVFDSDNQTVKQAKLEFARMGDESVIELDIVNWPASQADVWNLFDLDASGNMDYTALTPSQLVLRKLISGTKGQFVRAK